MTPKVAINFQQKKKKGKAGYLLVILGLMLILGVGFVIFSKNKVGETVNNEVTQTETVSYYYLPQTHFKTLENSIDLEELKDRKIYFSANISEEEFSELEKLTGIEEINKINPTYEDFSQLEKDAILISYAQEKDVRLKSLSVNGLHLFEKETELGNYPLRVDINVSKGNQTQLAEDKVFAKDEITTMFAGGEIITARAVDRLWLNETNNSDLLFDRIKNDIEAADIAVSMLENSYLGDPKPCQGCTTFVSDEKVIQTYQKIGLDVLSLAGNHAGDAGSKGYGNTRQLLDEVGIKNFGTGDNIEAASKHIIHEVNGIKFAFLGADDVAYFYWAGEENQGLNKYSKRSSNGVLTVDEEKIQKDIAAAKAESDFVIVFMSWGIEYQNYATKHQEEMAKEFVNSGVDLVLGTHPHWVQNIEVMKNDNGQLIPVWYSLGNLLFDQTHTDPTREAIYVNMTFYGQKLIDMRMVPHKTCGYHQTSNNLAYKVASGELSYEEVDKIPENQGCVWWQPTPVAENSPLYSKILERVWEHSDF